MDPQKYFNCTLCGQLFCNQTDLCAHHIQNHSKLEENQPTCIPSSSNNHPWRRFKCDICGYSTDRQHNLKRHIEKMHPKTKPKTLNSGENNKNDENARPAIIPPQKNINEEVYDVRLKENFKLFISGPSRCGKTYFVSDLLENIDSFAKQPPSTIVYVYKVWQPKFDEMKSIVHMFIKDNENVVNKKISYWAVNLCHF